MDENNLKPAQKIDDPIELSEHALYFYCRHQWKQAVPYYERLFQDFPGERLKEQFFSEIALCFLNLDDYDSAIEYLKEGMKRYQNIKKHKVLYAEALRLKGFHYQAKTLYEKLIGIYPDDIDILQNHYMASANYYIRKDDIDKAINCFKNCKALIPKGRSRNIIDIEIEGWKLVRDIKGSIKKSWNFKILEKKLTPLLKSASDLDEKNLEIAGLLPMYEKIIECILESLKGQPIDQGFCKNLIKLNEDAGFYDNANFLSRIIRFNSYVLDLHESHFHNIPDSSQKKAISILRTKTNEGLSLNRNDEFSSLIDSSNEEFEDEPHLERKYHVWTVDGKNSGTINEGDFECFKKSNVLFVDDDKHIAYLKGKQIPEIKELPYALLVILMKNGGQYMLGKLSMALYGEDGKAWGKLLRRQRAKIAGVKMRLKEILENKKIATIEYDNQKYFLRPIKNKYEDFEFVLVKRANIT